MDVATIPVPSVETDPHVKPEPEDKLVLTPPASVEADKQDGPPEHAQNHQNEKEEDDIGEITPDHYWGGGQVPVFRPTMKEFESFPKYIRKIDKYGMQSGIVKVIPPKEWTHALPQLDEMVKTIKVKNPIMQEFHGQHGIYTQANMEKQRSYNLPQWKALTEESNHQPPAKRGERRRNQEKESKRSATLRAAKPALPVTPTTSQKRGRGRPPKNKSTIAASGVEEPANEGSSAVDPDRPLTPASPSEKLDTPQPAEKPTKTKKSSEKAKPKNNGPKSVTSRRMQNTSAQGGEIDEEAFKGFDYRIHDHEEWTPERCKELEVQYWKSLNFSNPMYGADMPGSLFDDRTTSWNVAKLENLLDVLGTKVPGVNTAYLYLGMWKATFAWHLEDVDLYSINYIHFGAPKQWYSISQKDARKFEKAMKSIWSSDAKNCDQFLRHKTYLVSPQILKSQYGVEVNRLVHNEGEFVITFPYGYHSGYNLGYNCAESVNFATEAWLEYGKIAKKCNCEADSVWVDVYEIERKLRGEPTPEYEEYYEDEDDDEIADLPTPPSSDKDQFKVPRKRKLNGGLGNKAKRVRLTVKPPPKPVCKLCPNNYSYEPLLRTEEGDMAHRICALYVPETYVTGPDGQEVVAGVRNIDRKRLELKCLGCRSKHGAVFQCSSRKCARAYHATCAAPAGVSVEIGMTSFYGEDGTEYQDVGIDFRCRFHRPKRPKCADENTFVETLEKNVELYKFAQGLQQGDCVQYQYHNGDIRAGYVVENRESEQMVLLYTIPQRMHIEVEYKFVLYLDKADQQLKPPSKDALPMPAHLAHKSSTTQEDPTSDTPKTDEPFHDPNAIHRWAGFETAKLNRNSSQVTVDFSKSNSLWYYLGRTSTEARAQFTHDLSVAVHNPASNFLDTVTPVSTFGSAGCRPSPALTQSTPRSLSTSILPSPGNGPVKRPRGRPPGSKKKDAHAQASWLHGSMIDPTALRNQQAFMAASAGRPFSVYSAISKPGGGYPAHQPTHPSVPPLQTSLHHTAAVGSRPASMAVFAARGSPATDASNFSRASTHSHTSPSSASFRPDLDSQDAELLKKLVPYPYLLRCAKSRPAVYQSPYGPPGIVNEAWLPLPEAPRPAHARHTSLSQDFLSSRSPSQRESVQGHIRAVSTEKATAVAAEAERRQREYQDRHRAASQPGNYFSDAAPPPARQMEASPALSLYQPPPHQPHSATERPYPNPSFHQPHSFHRQTSPPSPQVARPALQFSTPLDFQQQMAREAAALERQAAGPSLAGQFSAEGKAASGEAGVLRIYTPPASSHGSNAFGGASGDGTSGSPLRVGRDGAGGEMLPVMQGNDD